MTEILIDRTGQAEVVAASDGGLTVTVPIRIKRRGLRKVVTLPDGGSLQARPWDDTPPLLQLALARGHHWLALLESGDVTSMKEIARSEGVDDSYVSRMVNGDAATREGAACRSVRLTSSTSSFNPGAEQGAAGFALC